MRFGKLWSGWRERWRVVAGCALLGWQVSGIAAARFGEERYFCWAPYDQITQFELSVAVAGRELSREEIKRRYRLPDVSRDNRSWAHVPAVIAQYERTLGRADGALVEYRHRVNGGVPRVWRWPDAVVEELSP